MTDLVSTYYDLVPLFDPKVHIFKIDLQRCWPGCLDYLFYIILKKFNLDCGRLTHCGIVLVQQCRNPSQPRSLFKLEVKPKSLFYFLLLGGKTQDSYYYSY